MKPLFVIKHIATIFITGICLTSCQKYTNTPPAPLPSPPPGYYDQTNEAIVYNGNLIISGDFTTLYGNTKYIAEWNGTSWQSLGSGINGPASLIIYNGNLIAAGNFDSAGGKSANGIAQWNGTSWSSLGYNAGIRSWIVYNGNLIVAGCFNAVGNVTANNIASWNGTSWSQFGGGITGVGTDVLSLTIYNGNLIAAGQFSSAGGVAASNIAEWNGSTWVPIGGKCNNQVSGTISYNGDLIAFGAFDTIGGIQSIFCPAQWNGTSWSSISSLSNGVMYPVVYNGNIIYTLPLTGFGLHSTTLYQWNGTSATAIATMVNTKQIPNPNPNYIEPYVVPLCVFNNNLIIGGWFTSVNGISSTDNLVQWNGTTWSAF